MQRRWLKRYLRSPGEGFRILIDRAEWVGLAGIVVITLALAADVFARCVLNKPLQAIKELVELLFPISWAFLLAETQAAGSNIKILFLTDRMGPRLRAGIEVFVLILSLGLFAAMTWQTGIVAWGSILRREYIMVGIEYPLYPTRIMVFFGCFLLCLQLLKETVQVARRINPRTQEK